MAGTRTEDLIDTIYEASVAPELWPAVLDELTLIGNGRGGLLFTSDGNQARWLSSPSLKAQFAKYVEDGWPQRTTRVERLINANYPGFMSDLDVYSEEEIEREAVYTEFLRLNGVGWGSATAIPIPTGDMVIISVEREYEKGPVERERIARLDLLRSHLARSALLATRLGLERARTAAETMKLLGLPGGVLARGGRLIAANALMQQMIPAVFEDRRTRLTLADADADRLLAQAFDQVDRGRHTGGLLSVPVRGAAGRPPMIVHCVPVRGVAGDVFSAAAAVLVVTSVEPKKVPTADVLQGLFDLTPAEARVARAVAQGQTLEALAANCGLSKETIRSQLKMTLAKTGMRRQAELAGLLTGLTAPLS